MREFKVRKSPGHYVVLSITAVILVLCSCAGVGILSSSQAEFDRGLSLFNQEKYEDAVPHFRRATELDPEFAKAYLYLGRSYLNLDRWADAVPPLRTAFRLSPEESKKEVLNLLVDALFGAAVFEFNQKDFDDSIGYLKEVLQLEPNSSRARKELVASLIAFGGAMVSQGKTPEGIAAYSEALKLSPDSLDAYIGLANAFLNEGDILRALWYVETALRIDPKNEEVRSLFREVQER